MRALGPFFIQAPGQRGEALGLEDLTRGGGAQGEFLGLEGLADFIDRMVLLAQSDDEGPGGGLFRLGAGAGPSGQEERRLRVVTEAVAKDPKGARGVAEGAGDRLGRAALDEIAAEGFILAVFGQGGLEEETAGVRYIDWCSDSHINILSHTTGGVKRGERPLRLVGALMAISSSIYRVFYGF